MIKYIRYRNQVKPPARLLLSSLTIILQQFRLRALQSACIVLRLRKRATCPGAVPTARGNTIHALMRTRTFALTERCRGTRKRTVLRLADWSGWCQGLSNAAFVRNGAISAHGRHARQPHRLLRIITAQLLLMNAGEEIAAHWIESIL